VILLAGPALADTWTETGDAGDLPGSAQIPTGAGSLDAIIGTLDASDADMFCIHIDTPTQFVGQTCGGASWDTQLFLFRADGMGVGMNDDGCSLQSMITSATMNCPNAVGPGDYYIAITRYNRDPVDAGGALLWLSGNAEHCADGPGAANPVAGWTGTTSAGGAYTISFTAVSFCGGGTPVESSTWGAIKSLYR